MKQSVVEESNKIIRQYFETGCLCLMTNKIQKSLANDHDAVSYYMKNCHCSRHPESKHRECWDLKADNDSIFGKFKLVLVGGKTRWK